MSKRRDTEFMSEGRVDFDSPPGIKKISLDVRKLVFGVSDRMRHKSACTVTEAV